METTKPKVICGAKNKQGKPCQKRPIKSKKRCKMHGGNNKGAPKGNSFAVSHGLYASGYTDEELDIIATMKHGDVIEELKLARIQVMRIHKAIKMQDDSGVGALSIDEEETEEETSDTAGVTKRTRITKRNLLPMLDRALARVESLEKAQANLANQSGNLGSIQIEPVYIQPDEETPNTPIY